MSDWKLYQQIYNSIVHNHSDGADKHVNIESPDVIQDALNYIQYKDEIGYMPGKARMVSIIYATKMQEYYGGDFYDYLNDPELMLNHNEWFKVYHEDRETYDKIIKALKHIPNWIDGGWAPTTVNYWWMESTKEGLEYVNNKLFF